MGLFGGFFFGGWVITLQNYVNAELDKTEMLMNLKTRTLSTEIEYYQEIQNVNLCNIMAEGFRFTPLGLVRLRTFRLSTWVS